MTAFKRSQAKYVEARLGCKILNRMVALGMPESYRVD